MLGITGAGECADSRCLGFRIGFLLFPFPLLLQDHIDPTALQAGQQTLLLDLVARVRVAVANILLIPPGEVDPHGNVVALVLDNVIPAGESGGSKRKRKPTDDTNRPEVFAPRLGKRRRTKKVEEMDKTDETEKMPAGKSANSSQMRRSKRRKPSTVADEEEEEEEEDIPEPPLKRRKVVGTWCDGPSRIPQPQALGPLAPAVSQTPPPGLRRRSKRLKAPLGAATVAEAPPNARGERLRSLRPRVNGKAATVSTVKTRGGEKT